MTCIEVVTQCRCLPEMLPLHLFFLIFAYFSGPFNQVTVAACGSFPFSLLEAI